jgi:CDP-diacylglycerol--serine O-phosphatidyltransferase
MSVASRLRIMRRRGPRVATDPSIRALRAERRRARLKVLPSLFTLGNAVCGFAAIVQVAAVHVNLATHTIENPENFVHAAWLIVLAGLFDGIDGRIARLTQSTGDFGGELDSLCDAVSFGVAPGLMVAMSNARAIAASQLFAKMSWFFGAWFACAAILRLARFNVENSHDEDAHLSFKGLPSPAAAGTIITTVLFQGFLRDHGYADAAA